MCVSVSVSVPVSLSVCLITFMPPKRDWSLMLLVEISEAIHSS